MVGRGYPWADGEVGLKLTAPLSRVPALLAAARATGAVAVRGSAGTGVLYAGLPGAAPRRGRRVVEQLRAAATRGRRARRSCSPRRRRCGEVVDMWGPVAGLALMRRVKDQFDPGTGSRRAGSWEASDGRVDATWGSDQDPPRDVLGPVGRRAGVRRPPPAPRRADRRLRALRVLPAHLPDVRAVGRGDGLAARPDPPDEAGPRTASR